MMVNESLQTWLIEAGIVRIAPVSENYTLDLSHGPPLRMEEAHRT